MVPDKFCPIQELKTYFFKPKYPKLIYNYIKFQDKNISLEVVKKYKPTAFTDEKKGVRDRFLNQLGFKLESKMKSFNLYKVPYKFGSSFINKIKQFITNKFQKINRFLNYQEYVSKSLLYLNYKKIRDKYPLDFDYMFETYSFPEEKEAILRKFRNYSIKKDNDLWMIKPKLGSLGSKIRLLKDISSINLRNYILTKYLKNPYLIRGYKNDFRFHGLVTSIKPLKLYLYNEGLVRLASEKYNSSISSNQNDFAILTNIFINKKNKVNYKYPINISNIEDSNLWNLETFQNYCENNNINYNKMFSEVGDIFIKTMLSVRKKIIGNIEKYKLNYSNFYHLIGFDIIFDENLKPYLLEANRRCSFRYDNVAEKFYAYNIMADTLNIVGIIPNFKFDYQIKKKDLKDILEQSLCELSRPRGGYKLIFPLKNNINKYKKLFGENIPEEDELLWKNLIE